MFSPGTAHGFHRGYCHPASPPRDGAERALLRLQQAQDSEALHDLRVCLRRIRSLLRPLRCPGATRLDRAAAELGRLTTPLRDLEVLIAELARHRLDWQANVRRSDLQARCRQLLTHPQLIDFPSLLRLAAPLPPHRATHRQIPPEPTPATPATATAPGIGRYRLRSPPSAAVDKTPALRRRSLSATPSSPEATVCLKAAQNALGDWHDREVWCLQAEHQADLWPLLPLWQVEQRRALARADTLLAALSPALAAKTGGASRS